MAVVRLGGGFGWSTEGKALESWRLHQEAVDAILEVDEAAADLAMEGRWAAAVDRLEYLAEVWGYEALRPMREGGPETPQAGGAEGGGILRGGLSLPGHAVIQGGEGGTR
jgi:hypothetical protein